MQIYVFTIYQMYPNRNLKKKTSYVPDIRVSLHRNRIIMQYPAI